MKNWLSTYSFAAAALTVTAGCATETAYAKYAAELTQAQQLVEQSGYRAAVERLEALLGDSTPVAATYALQRYHADLLLERAHMLASVRGPFLPDAVAAGGGGARAREQVSPTAHLVAAALCISYARDWQEGAAALPRQVEGQDLLPAALQAEDGERVAMRFAFDGLVIATRLGFRDKVDRALDRSRDDGSNLFEFSACTNAMNAIAYPADLRSWVYQAAYAYLVPRERDEEAYKFAVKLFAKRDTFTAQFVEEVRKWLTDNPRFVFKCHRCATPVNPQYSECQDCQAPVLDFRAERKNQ